jgi:Zn-dependent protease with chaperone function
MFSRIVAALDPSNGVFDALKQKGLIAPSRALVHKRPSSRQVNFRTDRLRHRIKAFGDLSKLTERSIAFSLLHEEGHLTRRQNSGWFFAVVLAFATIVASLALWHLLSGSPISSPELAINSSAIAIAMFSPRIFRWWLVKDEFRADAFAAEMMVRAYPGITRDEVAESLDSVLKAIHPKKRDFVDSIFLEWMGWDVHPSEDERIQAVFKGR